MVEMMSSALVVATLNLHSYEGRVSFKPEVPK